MDNIKRSYTFISAPYSNLSRGVLESNMKIIDRLIVHMLAKKLYPISLLTMVHSLIDKFDNIPIDSEFWHAYSRALVCNAQEMLILELPGYEDSAGMLEELVTAKINNIPTQHLSYGYLKSL